jgi:ABC-type transporter Mla subunit MlaD
MEVFCRLAQDPLDNLIIAVSGDAIYPLLYRLNSTILNALDVKAMVSDATCIVTNVRSNLPSPANLLNFVNDTINTVDKVTTDARHLQQNIGDIIASLDSTKPLTQYLTGNLTSMYGSTRSLNSTISAMRPDLDTIQQSVVTLSDGTTGLPAVSTDLSDFLTNLPPTSDATTLRSTDPNSLTVLYSGAMDGNGGISQRTSLRTLLTDFQTKINALPNLNTLATNIAGINAEVLSLRSAGTMTSLYNELGQVDAGIQGLPSLAALNTTVYAVKAIINSISVAAIRSTLLSFNDTLVNHLPNVSVVIVELDKISNIETIINCMDHLISGVKPINVTILELPSQFDSIADIVTSANSTYQSVNDQIGGFRSQLNSLNNISASLPNMTDYIRMIDDISDQITNPPVNFGTIDSALASAQSAIDAVDVTTLRSSIVSVNTSLWSPNLVVDNSEVQNLRNLEVVLGWMRANLTASVAALDTFITTRRCASTDTVCSVDDDASAPCDGGHHCSGGLRVCSLDHTKACVDDSDCGGGQGTCPYHQQTFFDMMANLLAYEQLDSDAISTAFTPVSTAVDDANTEIAGMPSISSLQNQISSMQDSIGSIPINSSLSSLASLQGSLDPSSLNLPTINNTINSVIDQVNGIDFATIKDQLESFQGTVDDVQSQISGTLDTVEKMAHYIDDFFFSVLPAQLPRLSRSSLVARDAVDGLQGVLKQIANVGGDTLDFVKNALNATGMGISLDINITKLVYDNLHYADVITSSEYSSYGPAYFFTSLANMDSVTPDEYASAGGGDIFNTASGASWPNSRSCYLEGCISETIDKYNKKPLSVGSMNAGISREDVMFYPFLIPLAICLFGFCGAVGVCGKSWQSVPACFSAFFICMVLPWIFIFAGALSFPMVMVISDACRGGPNLGFKYVSGSQASLCSKLPDGVYVPSTGACQLTLLNHTLAIHLADTYEALLGDCTTHPTVISDIFDQASESFASYPSRYLNDTLDDFTKGDGLIKPRPQLLNILQRFGVDMQGVATGFLSDLSGTFTCDTINRDISAIKDGFCCDFMTAFYWFVSSWYFMAFFMCICGFPASILGYKRFPNKLWGPDYDLRSKQSDGPRAESTIISEHAAAHEAAMVALEGEAAPAAAPVPAPAPPRAATPVATPVASHEIHPSVVSIQPRSVIELAPLRTDVSPASNTHNPVQLPMYQEGQPPMMMSPGGGAWMPGQLPPHIMMAQHYMPQGGPPGHHRGPSGPGFLPPVYQRPLPPPPDGQGGYMAPSGSPPAASM